MSKKTRTITYNLADRGREHNGIDRSDINIQSMVNHINAAATQELVSSGDLCGFTQESGGRIPKRARNSWP